MHDILWLHGTALAEVPVGDQSRWTSLTLPGHLDMPIAGHSVEEMAQALAPQLPHRFAQHDGKRFCGGSDSGLSL